MKKIVIVGFLFAAISFFRWANPARGGTPYIIINEIQIAGTNSNDEFIELFNPADVPISLESYKLSKKTKGGSESALVSASKFSGTIQARGYFLLAHPDCKDAISADLSYSSSTYSISRDNSILLYDKSGALLDKVGFGTASDFETAPAPNPGSNESIERTGFSDTDNNAADFSVNISPSPQNKGITEKDNSEESPDNNEPSENTESSNSTASDTLVFCATASPDIKLNEIFPYPENGEEFVEVINTGDKCIDISGWKIMDEAGHKKEFPAGSIISPGEYLVLEDNLCLNNDSDAVYLLGKNGNDKNDALDYVFYEKSQKGLSYSFDGKKWDWTSSPTPGNKNIITATSSEESAGDFGSEENYSANEKMYLNEIFPNPQKGSGDEEYIEIANGESGPADLFGWKIKDASKGKGYKFEEHIFVESGGYLTIYKSQSKIALNNSKESVYLHNPQGSIVSSVSYDKSQKNASYNFDGKNWKWSKYLTPGKKNKFDSEPSVKVIKPKNIFKDTFAEFSAKAKDKETKKLKYSWDFGDGKKSYLAKTSHKYLATGKYTVVLSVSDDSQTVEKSFVISVKKYPRPDLEIVKIVPNPAGNDSTGEIIEIKNNSGKKVSLDGWKIATGSGEKSYNHPISDGIILNSGETKAVTREMSRFTLNNKAGKVRIVSPDGNIADEIEYEKDPPDSLRDSKRAGKIEEGEEYTKIDGEWRWIVSPEKIESSQEEDSNNEENNSSSEDGEILGATDENIPGHFSSWIGYTPEDEFIFLKIFGLLEYAPRELNYCPSKNPLKLLADI